MKTGLTLDETIKIFDCCSSGASTACETCPLSLDANCRKRFREFIKKIFISADAFNAITAIIDKHTLGGRK